MNALMMAGLSLAEATAPERIGVLPVSWRNGAGCRSADPELFFPLSSSDEAAEPARQICNACPVRAWCLTEALAAGMNLEGVWAGTTPAQRRTIRRRGATS